MVKSFEKLSPDIRQAALDAARRLFSERGFHGTAIQDVAAVVGVSKQAVHHHFQSKGELREAVLAELIAHWDSVLPRLLAGASGSARRFTTVLGELVRFFYTEPSWARLVVRELLDRPEHTRVVMRKAVRPWLMAVADYVRAGQGAGILREDVDADAWAAKMLELALFGATANPVFAGALLKQADRRLAQELNRIARTSLFRDRTRPKVEEP